MSELRMLTAGTADELLVWGATLLAGGGVAVIPTDTVYGLAAHPACGDAVARLGTIKGRPTGKPIALLAADAAAVAAFGVRGWDGRAERLAARWWPGALTLVLQVAGGAYEGFRVPDHVWTRRLLAACGGVLRVTSANLSGAMPATDAEAALRDVGLEADGVVDDGPSPGGVASTVVKIDEDGRVAVLREGAIATADVMACLGEAT